MLGSEASTIFVRESSLEAFSYTHMRYGPISLQCAVGGRYTCSVGCNYGLSQPNYGLSQPYCSTVWGTWRFGRLALHCYDAGFWPPWVSAKRKQARISSAAVSTTSPVVYARRISYSQAMLSNRSACTRSSGTPISARQFSIESIIASGPQMRYWRRLYRSGRCRRSTAASMRPFSPSQPS